MNTVIAQDTDDVLFQASRSDVSKLLPLVKHVVAIMNSLGPFFYLLKSVIKGDGFSSILTFV